MSANEKIFQKIVDEDYFTAERSLEGDNLNLSPKCTGVLDIKGNIKINGETPGSAGGAIVKDDNGNVNLGPDKGANKNTVTGDNNVASGMHNTVAGKQDLISGNNNTLGANSLNSAIIGGQNNTNDKVGSVILGGYNITAYRDNTAYVTDLKIEGVQVFGVDPISRKFYGEFNREVDGNTSMTVPHAATGTGTKVGYIKLVYKGSSTITSAKFDDTTLTCDGTWKETIIDAVDHGMIIALEGEGTFSYTAEINETVIEA